MFVFYSSYILILIMLFLQKHIYDKNIFKVLDGPCDIYKRLQDYTEEEVASYPKLVELPHM